MQGQSFSRHAAALSFAFALLAGCGRSQPIGAPGAMTPPAGISE